MKFVDQFDSFLEAEVNLNQTRLTRLETSIQAIDNYLADAEEITELFLETIPAGSWAHRSIIRPVDAAHGFDADLLLSLDPNVDWEAEPKQYVAALYRALRASPVYRDKAHRKRRCVRIQYAGDFHVDVVPYVERHGASYIMNRLEPPETGRFELSNPAGFTAWIDERQRLTNNSFIKVVRIVKYLRDFKGTFACKSIILKTLLGQEVDAGEAAFAPTRYADVPTTLKTLMTKLAAKLPITMPAVLDPAETGDNFTDRYGSSWDYENFRTRIIDYAEKIEDAYEESNRAESVRKWRDIFGDGFHADVVTESSQAAAAFSAAVPWKGEQFIDRPPYSHPVSLDPRYFARITGRVVGPRIAGRVRRKGFRQYTLSAHGNLVQKQRNIEFTVETNVPEPYRVFWKVRNGGREAAGAECLRGEITATRTKIEPTEYAGTHYVEAYIVKGGKVVAKDHQTVAIMSY